LAKLHLDRLRKKYNYRGGSLNDLMEKLIAQNSENISKKALRNTKANWEKAIERITTKKDKFIAPRVDEVLPEKGIFVNKAVERGKLITDTLRDSLTSNMRRTIKEFRTEVGEPTFIRRRGAKAGTINPKLIDSFEKKIRLTFQEYTKKDPRFGVPGNVKEIATTEMRSNINDMKLQYMKKLNEKNEGKLKVKKTWIHNATLSRNPRKGHRAQDNRSIAIDKKFKVKAEDGLIDLMDRPHDPKAPPGQVIGCNCDLIFSARKVA